MWGKGDRRWNGALDQRRVGLGQADSSAGRVVRCEHEKIAERPRKSQGGHAHYGQVQWAIIERCACIAVVVVLVVPMAVVPLCPQALFGVPVDEPGNLAHVRREFEHRRAAWVTLAEWGEAGCGREGRKGTGSGHAASLRNGTAAA